MTTNSCLKPKIFLAVSLFLFAATSIAAENSKQVSKASRCGNTAMEKSDCMIRAALKDLNATYGKTGGGGITEIKLLATNQYRFSISQEERIDQVTYDFEFKPDGRLQILKRSDRTRSMGK